MSKKKEVKSDAIRDRVADLGIEERDVTDAIEWARGGEFGESEFGFSRPLRDEGV